MENSMFDTLLELPFFQGMGRDEMTEIVENIPLHFDRIAAGKKIVGQDENCDQLVFVIKGTLRLITEADHRLFALSERIQAPAVIQPEALFGIYPRYSSTYLAQTEVSVIRISKAAALGLIGRYDIFRLNLLNYLSTGVFKRQRNFWNLRIGESLEQRIIRFIWKHVQYPAGEKILHIRMKDLADLLNDTRINVSNSLNSMQKQNLLILRRKEIIIPAIEKLTE